MAVETLHEMVHVVAHKYGARVAVKFDSGGAEGCGSLTYNQLLFCANELTDLFKMHGVLKEQIIGLYCQPGISVPSWILGILQLPAAYMPVDPDAPCLQSVAIMEQCGLEYSVVQSDIFQRFHAVFSDCVSVEICAEWPSQNLTLVRIQSTAERQTKRRGTTEHCPPSAWRHGVGLAYVLHTSGTTGFPKTVKVPHQCIVPNITDLRALFQVTESDVVFMASPLTFDPSVVEMFLALSSGACLLMVPTVFKKLPTKLATVLFSNNKTTVLQATPTLLTRFGRDILESVVLSAVSPLRVLALGGEVFPSLALLRNWRQQGNATRIFNLYGITEVSCWACYYEVPESQLAPTAIDGLSVPLGAPLKDTTIEVRDEMGSVVTSGEGQVYIGGERRVCCLGDETMVVAGTMRSTGDWVEVKNAHVYYLGRKDRLVKRHGQQIHLDAIHMALQRLPQVDACAVTFCNSRLAAFVVPNSAALTEKVKPASEDCPLSSGHPINSSVYQVPHGGEHITFSGDQTSSSASQFFEDSCGNLTPIPRTLQREILHSLSKLLPSHGIPDTLVLLSRLPSSTHGKVSMDELLKIYNRMRRASFSMPRNRDAVADGLQTLWKDVLGLPEDTVVPADTYFLLSGGDSLQCLCLCDDIASSMGIDPPALLDVVLNGSFSDIVSYVATALFPFENSTITQPTAKEPPKESSQPSSSEPTKRLSTQSPSTKPTSRPSSESSSSEPTKRLSTQSPFTEPTKRPSSDSSSSEPTKKRSIWSPSTEPTKRPSTQSLSPEPAKRPSMYCVSLESVESKTVARRTLGFIMLRRAGEVVEVGPSVPLLNSKRELLAYHGVGHSLTSPLTDRMDGCSAMLSLHVRWTSDTGRCVDASPVLLVTIKDQTSNFTELEINQTFDWAKTTVYIGSHSHRLQAIDFSTGELRWERVLGDRIESSAVVSRCGCFIAVGCYDGQVYFLCADTGETHWVFGTGDAVKSSPTVDQLTGLVVVGSHDGHLYALNVEGRHCTWAHACGGGGVFSSPCFHPSLRQLYVATLGGRLLSLNADSGARLWMYNGEKPFFSSPHCSQSCICIGSVDGNLYGFSHTGEKLWQFSTSGPIFSSPCAMPDTQTASQRVVCGSHDGCVYCISSTNGTLVWQFQTGSRVFSCPFALNGSPWGCPTLVAVTSTDGTLWLLNGDDGSLRGSLQLPGELFSSPVLWQCSLVVGCRNDLVYCIDISK